MVHWMAPLVFATLIAVANVCGYPFRHDIAADLRYAVCYLHGDDRLHDCQLRALLRLRYWRQRTSS